MTIRILDIELSAPLPAIVLSDDEGGMLGLVRWHHRPIGLVKLQGRKQISPGELETAIRAQVVWPVEAPPAIALSPSVPLSIVVCTHERPDDLRRCLHGLLPLAAKGHEILVVDNAPRDHQTATIVAAYPYRYLCEPQIGLNNARNLGLKAATHAIVAYTDDDAVVDPKWADALADAFTAPEVGCVTGLVLPLELETPAQEQFEIYCTHRRSFIRQVFVASAIAPAAAGIVGMGANMAVRRKLALKLGGFDPCLDAGTATLSGGDTDMFARILDAGATIIYSPDALVWHRHRRDLADLHQCIYGYGVGLYSFLTKRLTEAGDVRSVLIAARWLIGPLVKAIWRLARGQAAVPATLLFLEMRGAFAGPVRFWQARRRLGSAQSSWNAHGMNLKTTYRHHSQKETKHDSSRP